MSEKKEINYKLHGIQEVYCTINKKPENFIDNIFEFHVNVQERVKEEINVVIGFVTVKIFNKDSQTTLADLQIACGFEVKDFPQHITKQDDGKFFVPPEFSQIVHAISISTVRGYMYAQLKGSYLDKAILPIIEVQLNKGEKSEKV